MEKLKENWVTEGLIDFEYKKYMLLAYLKHVKLNFDNKKLYPFLSDLIFHYQNLRDLKDSKKMISDGFPKSISKADFKSFSFTYKELVEDDQLMSEIKSIVGFAINKVGVGLKEGQEIYDYFEDNIEISPVGITPLNSQEGYVFLTQHSGREYAIFKYLLSVFQNSVDKYRGINFEYLGTFQKRIIETFENIKQQLIKTYNELPNPAAFLMHSKVPIPINETYIPLAKRMLVRHVEI